MPCWCQSPEMLGSNMLLRFRPLVAAESIWTGCLPDPMKPPRYTDLAAWHLRSMGLCAELKELPAIRWNRHENNKIY